MIVMTLLIRLNSLGQIENPDDILIPPLDEGKPSVSMMMSAPLKSGTINKTMQLYIVFEGGASAYNTVTNRNNIVSNLNTVFSQIGLTFHLAGYPNVSSTSSYNYYWYPYAAAQPTRFYPGFVLKIYDGTAPGYSATGYPVSSIGGGYYFNKGDSKRKNVLAHEVGHAFGLMHPRYGTMYNFQCEPMVRSEVDTTCRQKIYFYDYTPVPELVDGSNGDEAGDFCTDTEANPSRYTDPDGNLLKDEQGDYYESLSQGKVMMFMTSDNYTFSSDQKKIMHNFVDNTIFNRTFSKTLSCEVDLSFGHSYTASLNDDAPSSPLEITWSITNNSGAVSINSSTGVITVSGNGSAVETITCTVKQKRYWHNSYYFYQTFTKTVNVNMTPSAPTISYPYNMSTYAYEANPLETGTQYRFQMSNCGTSTTNTDFVWTYNSMANIVFQDINGNDVADNGEAYGKTCYIKAFEDCDITLHAKCRLSSMYPWSYTQDSYLTFSGGMLMMFSPNPVSLSSEAIITLSSTTDIPIDYNVGWDIEVVDLNYGKKLKEKVKQKEFKLKTIGWKSDTYIVIAKYKDKTITGKLKVE